MHDQALLMHVSWSRHLSAETCSGCVHLQRSYGCAQIAGSRRAPIGPAAPTPELLAAAAQIPWQEDDGDVEDLIGPAPPEMAEELDGVGGDERIAEVVRVIR